MNNSNPAELFVIRHGETEWNLKGIYQGQLNSGLTETGKRQSELLGHRLKEMEFDAIYSSDLDRCRETAELVLDSAKRAQIRFLSNLRERHLGIFSGKSRSQVEKQFPEEFKAFQSRDPKYRLPEGGESLQDKHIRFIQAFSEIAGSHPGEKVLVLTHGGALDSLFRECLKIDLSALRNYDLANLSWNHFQYQNNRWNLITWGDRSHLFSMDETSRALDV